MRLKSLLIGLLLVCSFMVKAQDAYIGEIRLFAGNFAPVNWAFCNGQVLSISSNSALFSILGTTYGGNGVSTFALPDLRGRVPIHSGNSYPMDGVTIVQLGEKVGSSGSKIVSNNLPFMQVPMVKYKSDSTGTLVGTVVPNSNVVPYNPYQPSMGLNYIICLYGIYPSRS